MGVGDDEADPGKPPVLQGAQEPGPERLVLAVTDVDPEDLPGALRRDPGGHDDRPGHHLAEGVVADVDVGGVQVDVGEGDVAESPVPEGLDPIVEAGTDPAHLGLGDPRVDPHGGHQVVDGPG